MTQAQENMQAGTQADQKPSGWGRAVVLVAVLVAAVLIIHLTPVRAWLTDTQRLRAELASMGAWVYPLSIAGIAVLLGCGVPRLPIHAAGGMIFGFWIGLAITLAGALLGHYGVFLFIRWGGRDWALRRWLALQKWAEWIHDQGIGGVILIRQAPVHAMLTNLSLGLSHVKHRHFLIGTMMGLIPEAVPATLVGAGIVKSSLKDSAGYLALAAVSLALIWLGCGYALRSLRKRSRQVTTTRSP